MFLSEFSIKIRKDGTCERTKLCTLQINEATSLIDVYAFISVQKSFLIVFHLSAIKIKL